LDEAAWIVETIKQRRLEGAAWSENMILCRTAYSARPVEGELIQEKIPYRFIGGMSLLQMAHVRDLLAVLRLRVNHRDELAWLRYLTLWNKIGEKSAARVIEQVTVCDSVEAAVEALAVALKNRQEIVELPNRLQGLDNQPSKAISVAFELLSPVLEPKYDNWQQRQRDFSLLERLAENHRTISGFLETYTLDPISSSEASPEQQNDEGLVTLITVHSAKGTECEACFVPAAQPGNYPHARSLDDPDAIEEERRVLYVALTRAKDELYISRHLSRGYGRTSWNAAAGAHYFLADLPTSLVDEQLKVSTARDWWDDDVIG
jgi:DNA helicase-2/ATP-dependent DNA helicase PcrA